MVVPSADVVVTQDFFPMIGGAHHWLHETYRRWPTPVNLLTRHYNGTPSEAEAQGRFDAQDHGLMRIVRADIGIDDINLTRLSCWRRYAALTKRILGLGDSRGTTVHCLRAFPEGFAGLLAKLRRPRTTRLVVYAHGEEMLIAQASRQLSLIARMVYRHADVIIANSRNTRTLVGQMGSKAPIAVVHPGVEAKKFVRAPAEIAAFRKTWGWGPSTTILCTVARMEERKNQAAVIRAIASLRSQGVDVAYVCAGGGEELSRLRELVDRLGLNEWVKFPGRIDEEQKILTFAAADVFIMPSVRAGDLLEGFGIVFIEAAAAGIPSICGRDGGQPEAVLDGLTGLVVDGTSDNAIAQAIRTLATDSALRGRMGAAARERAAELDWSNVSANVRAALSGHGGLAPARAGEAGSTQP